MAKFTVRQGEALPLPFRIKDPRIGKVRNLTGATFALYIESPDGERVIVKTDSDFDKSGVAVGYVVTFIEAQETIQEPGVYEAELRITTADTPPQILKPHFEFEIEEATAPNDWIAEVTGIVSLEAFGEPEITQ